MQEYLEKIILPCADGISREVVIPNNNALLVELRDGIAAILNAVTRRSTTRFMTETEFYDSADPYAAGDIVLMTSDDTNEIIAVLDNAAGEGQRKLLWSKDPEFNMLVGVIASSESQQNIYHNGEFAFTIPSSSTSAYKIKYDNDVIDLAKEWTDRYYLGPPGAYIERAIPSFMNPVTNMPHIGVVISCYGVDLGIHTVADLRGIRFLPEVRPGISSSSGILNVTATEKLILDRQMFMQLSNCDFFLRSGRGGKAITLAEPVDFHFNKVISSRNFITYQGMESIRIHANSFTISEFCFFGNEKLKELVFDCKELRLDIPRCAFQECSSLETIRFGNILWPGTDDGSLYRMFAGCSSLRTIEFEPNYLLFASVSFADCPLSLETARRLLSALGNISGFQRTIEFSAYTYNKLNASDIAIGTRRGWTVIKVSETETT